MKVLELFSGTRSVGKCCDVLGWECVSLDINDNCDIKCDILEWDYKIYDKDEFDIIWASPPCASFSRLQRSAIRKNRKDGKVKTLQDIEENMKNNGDPIVKRTLEIIKYFTPELWFLENPQTGFLKDREYMKDLPYYDVDYCMYSDWGYRKRTRIWTNKKDFKNLMCGRIHGHRCNNRIGQRHKVILGQELENYTTLDDRYRIPEELIYSLFLE
jgi:site-specific DNA-cytosine methylase